MSRDLPSRVQAEPEVGWRAPITAILLVLMLLPTAIGVVRSAPREGELLELGWHGVVRQSSPNLCGPAVVATLLRQRGQRTSDLEIAANAHIQSGGVSLAEFDRLATAYGFPGQWFRVGKSAGRSLPQPSVVHLSGAGSHFAVLERSVSGFVQLADPARGRVLMPLERFEREWSGRVFLFGSAIDRS